MLENGLLNLPPLGRGAVCFRTDTNHHRLGNNFFASLSSASFFDFAPRHVAFFPILAVADNGHGNARMDGHTPQAPRQSGNRRRPAQPSFHRHFSYDIYRCLVLCARK